MVDVREQVPDRFRHRRVTHAGQPAADSLAVHLETTDNGPTTSPRSAVPGEKPNFTEWTGRDQSGRSGPAGTARDVCENF